VSRSTVKDFEGCRHDAHRATESQLRIALENGGAEFINLEGGKMGLYARSNLVE
jgi:hypothetical protein